MTFNRKLAFRLQFVQAARALSPDDGSRRGGHAAVLARDAGLRDLGRHPRAEEVEREGAEHRDGAGERARRHLPAER